MIYPERFRNPIVIFREGIIPACLQFSHSKFIRRISINLVAGHIDKNGFRNAPARIFQQPESAQSIYLEIVEWTRCCQVVARLCCSMNNQAGLNLFKTLLYQRSISDVEIEMSEFFTDSQ